MSAKPRKKHRKSEPIEDVHMKATPFAWRLYHAMAQLGRVIIESESEVPDAKNYKGADWSEVG